MGFTIAEMWEKMGFIATAVVVILGVMSVYVVAISIERLIVFIKAKAQSRSYAMLIQDLLKQGKYREAADAALQFKHSHIARIIRSGLLEFIKGNILDDPEAKAKGACASYDILGAVNRAIEKSGAREMAGMRRGLAGLATVGSTAPFVGLFGTVFGIINSFQGMAAEGSGGLGSVSAGIAEALVTTGAGIGVAIVAVLLYNFFISKVDALQVDTNESALEILDVLVKRQDEPVAVSPVKAES
ncbi:MAG: MotA/TolQ/ExbB proton channel family protein [Deltaproteobacteria bacterium]|nr:MotA/TolQ/ExbB proton channel family protein [Deltaproteobacteria bacterium]